MGRADPPQRRKSALIFRDCPDGVFFSEITGLIKTGPRAWGEWDAFDHDTVGMARAAGMRLCGLFDGRT
jgi:hypothetical protein